MVKRSKGMRNNSKATSLTAMPKSVSPPSSTPRPHREDSAKSLVAPGKLTIPKENNDNTTLEILSSHLSSVSAASSTDQSSTAEDVSKSSLEVVDTVLQRKTFETITTLSKAMSRAEQRQLRKQAKKANTPTQLEDIISKEEAAPKTIVKERKQKSVKTIKTSSVDHDDETASCPSISVAESQTTPSCSTPEDSSDGIHSDGLSSSATTDGASQETAQETEHPSLMASAGEAPTFRETGVDSTCHADVNDFREIMHKACVEEAHRHSNLKFLPGVHEYQFLTFKKSFPSFLEFDIYHFLYEMGYCCLSVSDQKYDQESDGEFAVRPDWRVRRQLLLHPWRIDAMPLSMEILDGMIMHMLWWRRSPLAIMRYADGRSVMAGAIVLEPTTLEACEAKLGRYSF